jgi:hypothetical protein
LRQAIEALTGPPTKGAPLSPRALTRALGKLRGRVLTVLVTDQQKRSRLVAKVGRSGALRWRVEEVVK